MFTRILLVLLISFLSGCSLNRAASLRMLDERAKYGITNDLPDTALKEGGIEGFRNHPTPIRSREKVSACYIHYHELPSHDYFLGGWIAVVTEQPQWVPSRPNRVPKAPAIEDMAQVTKQIATKKKLKTEMEKEMKQGVSDERKSEKSSKANN